MSSETPSKEEMLQVITGLWLEHGKKAAEISGEEDLGLHGYTAKVLYHVKQELEQHTGAVAVLEELKNFDLVAAGMGHLIGQEASDPDHPDHQAWKSALNSVTLTVDRVQRIAKRGLRK